MTRTCKKIYLTKENKEYFSFISKIKLKTCFCFLQLIEFVLCYLLLIKLFFIKAFNKKLNYF